MKMLLIGAAIIMVAFSTRAQDTKPKTDTFKVAGNCSMCEENIEFSATKVKGVIKADWDQEKELLTLTYDTKITDVEKVQKAIAQKGYDTEKVKANDAAYEKLPACCKYQRIKY